MKNNILYLIHDDIKITRLIATLRKVGIEANTYATNNVVVIFDLMHIPSNELVQNTYLNMLERASGPDVDSERMKALANEVFDFLSKFSESEAAR